MRLARALILAALLLAPLLPHAQADHVYSHRLVIDGRVLSADGLPVPGREVIFSSETIRDHPCAGSPHQNVTDEWGDFRFCFHVHDLYASDAITVRVGNTSVEHRMDTATRRIIPTLILDPSEEGHAPPDWERTFHLTGRVWRGGSTVLEGVPVYGLVQTGVPVNLTITYANGTPETRVLNTTQFGDFGTTIVLDEGTNPRDVRLHMESLGHQQTRRLDTFTHRNIVGFLLPASLDVRTSTQELQDQETGTEPPPGSRTPPVSGPFVGALAVAIVLMLHVARRRSEKK